MNRLPIFTIFVVACVAFDVVSTVNSGPSTTTEPTNEFLNSIDHSGNPYRSMRFAATPTESQQCNEGLCCDKRQNLFLTYGRVCGEPQGECKIAICSGQSSECYPINLSDGTTCKNGRCFEGECIANCVGECCAGRFPKKDGEECDNGMCVNGVCVKKCYGDCCESFQAFAKPDGALCFNGTCQEGKCVVDGSMDDPYFVLHPEEMKDPLNGKKAITIIVDETKGNTLDSEWGKLVQEETKIKDEERRKELEKREAENALQLKEINEKRDQQVADLKAKNDSGKNDWNYWIYGIIGGGVFVVILVVILIVVALVVRNRKMKQRTKFEKDSAEAYEAF